MFATFTLFWKLCRSFCAWSMRSFNWTILLITSFIFEFKFALLFVKVLDIASIGNVALILIGLKQFDKVIFPLLSSVSSNIWESQLNSDIIRQSFGLSIISRSLQIMFSIGSSTKLQSNLSIADNCSSWKKCPL